MTAIEIHEAIKRDLFPAYAYLKEFRAGTGYGTESNRYLDAWAIQPYPSKPILAIGIEIKISRGDWLREIRKPMKRDSALRITNQFYFAAPAGMIELAELPDEAGLIDVWASGDTYIARIQEPAPLRECSFNLPFIASLARRVQDQTNNP